MTLPPRFIPAICGHDVMSAQTFIHQGTGGIEEMDTALPSPACGNVVDEGDYGEMTGTGSAVCEDSSAEGLGTDPVWDLPPLADVPSAPTYEMVWEEDSQGTTTSADIQGIAVVSEHNVANTIADLQERLAIALERVRSLDNRLALLPFQRSGLWASCVWMSNPFLFRAGWQCQGLVIHLVWPTWTCNTVIRVGSHRPPEEVVGVPVSLPSGATA